MNVPPLRNAVAVLALAATAGLTACVPAANPIARVAARHFEVPATTDGLRWYKGNTHTHTLESDGDSPPEAVARWYRDHGYNFLVLTDHNVFTDPKTLMQLMDTAFLLIPGEELTSSFEARPVHVNGLDIPHVLSARKDTTLLGTIQKNVDEIRRVDGVPHINHPNFGWAITAEILAQVQNDKLFEIFNGHPTVHNEGGGDSPGMEEVWDILLTGGKRMYGIAVDDAHHFTQAFAPHRANPGRGWVGVRARNLVAREIMDALEAGRFYASTGVELDDVLVTPTTLEVRVRPRGNFKYRIQFIGNGGRILQETRAQTGVYTLSDDVTYVRARVIDSSGAKAWVQPVFTAR